MTGSMNVWLLIAGCVVTTALIKAAGPVLLGGRELPAIVLRFVGSLAPALLAALVVTTALADGQHLEVGADTVGVAAGGVLLWFGRSVVLAVVVAMLVTALLRALF